MTVRTLLPLAFAAAAVLFPAAAHAQYSSEYDSCMARAHNNAVQQEVCAFSELSHQDGRLNKAYQQVMSQYPANDPGRIALRDDERTWLKKRDYDCKIDHNVVDNACLLDRTSKRADELEKRVKF